MLKTRQLLLIFIPALIVAGFGLFIGVLQYEPLFPKEKEQPDPESFRIPVSANDPILGNKKAPETIIAFGDFGCEACREADVRVKGLMEKYPNRVKVIWKGVPNTRFPFDTTLAHAYAYCASKEGKFALFKDYAFLNADNLTGQTLQTIVKDMKLPEKKITDCANSDETKQYMDGVDALADALNIQSLPAFFVDNAQIQAPQSVEAWTSALALD